MQYRSAAVAAVVSLLVGSAAAAAQQMDSAAIAAVEAAGAAVESVRMEPAALELAVGDTAEFTVRFLDGDGREVQARLPDGRTTPPAYMLLSRSVTATAMTGATLRVVGVEAAAGPTRIAVLRPPFPRAPEDRAAYDEFPLPITVTGAPTARVELSEPAYGAYAGTSVPLRARVWLRGAAYPETEPVVRWSSSDPGIALVDDDGVVTFVAPGTVAIAAEHGGVRAERRFAVRPNPAASVTLAPAAREARTGDVVDLNAVVKDAAGRVVDDVRVTYGVSSGAGGPSVAANAAVYEGGKFVAEQPGRYTVFATVNGRTATAEIRAVPRGVRGKLERVRHVPLLDFGTSEVMVFEGTNGRDYAYLGTWGNGDRVYVFDVTDPVRPQLTDSVVVDARVINDIRVDREKGARIAVFTREGASDRRNGIVILDVATDPAHPRILSEFRETTAAGVHDVWIHENRVYLTNDGTGDLHIVDITDPRNPRESGRWSIGRQGRYLHDLIVQDGILYLSYWDDGLVILDVGGGGKGGTLDEPVFISQYKYGPYGNTHHAYRYKDYVFVTDELLGREEGAKENGPGGYVRVIDVSDIENPVEVARYEVPEAGSHNTWVENDTMYVAHYQGGLRVVDVSGELRGDLYRQGREIAWYDTAAPEGKAHTPGQAMAWSPQPWKGRVFVSDLNSGMWILELRVSND